MSWSNIEASQRDIVMTRLSGIETILEEAGIDARVSTSVETDYPDESKLRAFVEIEFSSDLGEDVVENIEFREFENINIDGFIRLLREYADDFDVDEHAEELVPMRGKNGVPNVSISELIEDAQGIKDYLFEIANDVEKYVEKEYGNEELEEIRINESALEDCIYEIYKENWLCENVPSAERLDIRRQYEIDFLLGEETRSFEDYIFEEGYNGMLYVCREEFLNAEYEDREFVVSLLQQAGIDKNKTDEIMEAYDAYKQVREREREEERNDI